jgi:hypothetical protein
MCGSVYNAVLNDIRPNKQKNIIWQSISTSLNPVKSFQKLYFGENIVYPPRICQKGFYWRIDVTETEKPSLNFSSQKIIVFSPGKNCSRWNACLLNFDKKRQCRQNNA